METPHALAAFGALSQPTRLATFRLLIQALPAGLPAGEIAAALAVRQNTLSAHLAVLAEAGLVRGERQGRTIRYHAEIDRLRALLGFLTQDCCGGRPDLCAPLADALTGVPARPACEPNTETEPPCRSSNAT